MKEIKKEVYTIDAEGKVLGRLASEIALILTGKKRPDFAPYKDFDITVIVKNVDKMKFTGKKLKQKKYFKHTGYIGHLKEVSLEELFKKNPQEVLRKAVYGMLPKNKLRKRRIKRLKFV
jgi:large subunit ribosomal protein L13